MTAPDAGAYVCSRDDLHDFHYGWDNELDLANPHKRHGLAWSDSIAFTHCVCFGAAARAVEPLLVDARAMADLLSELLAHDEHRNGAWTSGMKDRVRAAVSRVDDYSKSRDRETSGLGPETAGGRDANQGAPRPPVPPSKKENA